MLFNFKIFYRKEKVKKIESAINNSNPVVVNIIFFINTAMNKIQCHNFEIGNTPYKPSDDINTDEWNQLTKKY
ncbi:tigger transposable element-derived protein 4-like [Aphis craccivora]|uniref:Tigger transposable element-derived protein 4-like n=1 Tax=Aphis craccivora TaxID=307492 RepID=A0A6G0ZFV9_APHCR|nr:tigger transposable element-derived protein 4-like [Aphis craccivora]